MWSQPNQHGLLLPTGHRWRLLSLSWLDKTLACEGLASYGQAPTLQSLCKNWRSLWWMFERQCVLHTTRPLLCIVAPIIKERPRRKKKVCANTCTRVNCGFRHDQVSILSPISHATRAIRSKMAKDSSLDFSLHLNKKSKKFKIPFSYGRQSRTSLYNMSHGAQGCGNDSFTH